MDAGEACLLADDDLVRGVNSERAECDEIGSFVSAKERSKGSPKNFTAEPGDGWTGTAFDAACKLIVSCLAGTRAAVSAEAFLPDPSGRLAVCIQIDTDARGACASTIKKVFGDMIDPASIVKIYANETAAGQNLSMRMGMRRRMRLYALALYFVHYTICRCASDARQDTGNGRGPDKEAARDGLDCRQGRRCGPCTYSGPWVSGQN